MVNVAVVGAGFGDEGKGLAVNYLATTGDYEVVVRHGGPQAGHTVVHNGIRHVFAQVGSGTLAGLPTHLSRFMLINLENLAREISSLVDKGIDPVITIDPNALCIFQDDVDAGRSDSRTISDGSTGMGVNAALQRMYQSPMNRRHVRECLKNLERINDAAAAIINHHCTFMDDARIIGRPYVGKVIFEGSQGLLLDRDSGFYPHVTPLDTGSKNPAILSLEAGAPYLETMYVTRSYLTRHGNGPLYADPMHQSTLPQSVIDHMHATDLTNVPNQYQGTLRAGSVCVDQMMRAINKDTLEATRILGSYSTSQSMMITHAGVHAPGTKELWGTAIDNHMFLLLAPTENVSDVTYGSTESYIIMNMMA